MAVQYLGDGEDFGAHHFSKDFGFHGSAEGAEGPKAMGKKGPHSLSHEKAPKGEGFAHGGGHPHGHEVIQVEHHSDGGVTHHHAHGGFTYHHPEGHVTHHDEDGAELGQDMGIVPEHHAHGASVHTHPHGSHVVAVEHHGEAEVHHHSHGGITIHHGDGRVTHHDAKGGRLAHGGEATDIEGNQKHGGHDYARGGHCFAEGGEESDHERRRGEEEFHSREHFARGGDEAEDKALIKKAFKQHDAQEHHGQHTSLHLRRGGLGRPGAGMTPPPGLGGPPGGIPMAPPRRRPPAPPAAGPSEPDFSGADGSGLRRGGRARR